MLTGVILAGGASVRYGKLKLSQRVSGKPVLVRIVEALIDRVDEVLIIASPHTSQAIERILGENPEKGDRVRVLRDDLSLPCWGPMRGVVTSLIHLQWSPKDEILVAPSDSPWLSKESVESLYSISRMLEAQVAVPVDSSGSLYLPFLYMNSTVFSEVIGACYFRAKYSRATDVVRVARRLALLGYSLVAGENPLSLVTFNVQEELENPREPRPLNASIIIMGGGNLFSEAYRREALGDLVGALHAYYREHMFYKSIGLGTLEEHTRRDLERIRKRSPWWRS